MFRQTRVPLLVALALCLPAGRIDAQAWLPAAAEAARAELASDWGFQGTVLLSGASQEPIAGAPEAFLYRADVSGTPWMAWGLLDENGLLVASALGRSTDPAAALRTFAADLAAFRRREGGNLFWESAPWLYPDANLSLEARVSLSRAVLDTRAADPSLHPGLGCTMAVPLQHLAYAPHAPVERVATLVSRAIAEWDVDQPPHQTELASCPISLYNALLARLNGDPPWAQRPENDQALVPLMSEIVARVTGEDRALHPGYWAMLPLVSGHHLYQYELYGAAVLAGRDPRVVHRFLADWWAAHAGNGAEVSHDFIRAAQRAVAALPESSAESAELREWVREATGRAVEALTPGTGFAALELVRSIDAGGSGGDVRWFRALPDPARERFVGFLIDGWGVEEPPGYTVGVARFLTWLLVEGALTPDQEQRVRTLLSLWLPVFAERALAHPPPSPNEYYGGELHQQIVAIAEAGHAVGLHGVVDPFLAAWHPPFPGNELLVAETAEEHELRLAQLRGFWRRHGALVFDREAHLVGNPEMLLGIDRYLTMVAPEVVTSFSLLDYGASSLGTVAASGAVFIQPFGGFSNFDRNHERLAMPMTHEHELGHLVHHRLPADFNVAWRRLYERSVAHLADLAEYDPDDYHCLAPGYAASRANEDVAEHVRAFFRDHPAFLGRAVVLARDQGKTVLLEKYLLLAQAFSRGLLGGDGSYPVLEAIETRRDWAEGGDVLHFRSHGRMRVSERDADGRVLVLTAPDVTYRFTWLGDRVGGVEMQPAGLLLRDGFESGDTAAWALAMPGPRAGASLNASSVARSGSSPRLEGTPGGGPARGVSSAGDAP